jgi:hypothetical protein
MKVNELIIFLTKLKDKYPDTANSDILLCVHKDFSSLSITKELRTLSITENEGAIVLISSK